MGQREYIILLPHKWPLGLPPGLEKKKKKKKKNPSVLVKAFLFSFLPFHFLIFLINFPWKQTIQKNFKTKDIIKTCYQTRFFIMSTQKTCF